jgi:hypothetical protein
MRALSGAIITAGAMIGVGLTALGFGIRFQAFGPGVTHNDELFGIPSMVLLMVVLLICAAIGLGITFLGLMYHHMHRYHELHGHGSHETGTTGGGTL